MDQELIGFLSSFVTEERKNLFVNILQHRTRYITVVLEDIYQSHNASAVLRSCDGFGIQDVHVIEDRNSFTVNEDIALGSSKWLTIRRYSGKENNTTDALNKLKKRGYRIVCASPDQGSLTLPQFDIRNGKVALLFGTEKEGLTKPAQDMADEMITIPMLGFTESFNISVSVAVILYDLRTRLNISDLPFHLSEAEKNELELEWLRKSIKNSRALEKEFYNRKRANLL
jgi:tRNA (guanosine-2'-O-)-methyltransferase